MAKKISDSVVENFQTKIFNWWKENKRQLPWRETTNPYFIMVSEIMLQQTQVNRSIEKYTEFINKFPTLESLATISTSEVIKTWSGLGYNRRALWLQEAAKQIINLGYFPTEASELVKLKGIGPYTSKSILIFAFNKDIATVDTNIRRILIVEGFAEEETSEKELFEIASMLVPKGKSRDWHNALMDYGSLVLTSRKTKIKPKTSQAKYDKSNRQYRGKIIRVLIQNQSLSFKHLQDKTGLSKEKLEKIITGLEKDGLIIKNKRNYSLP